MTFTPAYNAFTVASLLPGGANRNSAPGPDWGAGVHASLQDILYAEEAGAVGDGVTDNADAFTDLMAAVGNGSRIVFGRGTYLTSVPLVFTAIGVELYGFGGRSATTVIKATHSDGPVIRARARGFVMCGIQVSSSSARYTGSAGTNYGIHVEGPDSAAASLSQPYFHDVMVLEQPSHGVIVAGLAPYLLIHQMTINYCLGHGLVIDDGTLTGRTNKDVDPGLVSIQVFNAAENAGHGLVLGNPSGTLNPFRVHMLQLEFTDNAWDSSIRFTDHQMYMNGTNLEVYQSAFGGTRYGSSTMANGTAKDSRVTPGGGLYAKGDNLVIGSCRQVSLSSSIEIGADSRSVRIYAPRIFTGVYATAQTVAVTVPATATDVDIDWPPSVRFNATKFITDLSEGQKPVRVVTRETALGQVTNSDALTTLFTYSVPAGTLGTQRMIRVTLLGSVTNATGSDGDIVLRAKYGTVTFAQTTRTIASDASARLVRATAILAARDATGTQWGHMESHVNPDVGTVGGDSATATVGPQMSGHIAISQDSDTDLDLVLSVQLSTASTDFTFFRRNVVVELL